MQPSDDITARPPNAGSSAPLPYCLGCGYERVGLATDADCPECGLRPNPRAADLVVDVFASPLRRALSVALGRAPLGWWCLLPERLRVAARIQLVLWLTIATIALALFFGVGAHVRLVYAFTPTAPVGGETGPVGLADNAILGGIVRGDMNWSREAGAIPVRLPHEAGSPPPVPALTLVRPSLHPVVIASVVWAACIPAAGLLTLRFLLLPLTMRLMRRSMTPATRLAAAIAADASVASIAIACAAITILAATALFASVLLLPTPVANALVRATPATLLALLFVLPPILFTGAIRNDLARRVFSWPLAAAAMTFVTYLVGVGIGVGIIGATFAIATRAFG